MANVNKFVSFIGKDYFEDLCMKGNFPRIEFKSPRDGSEYKSYNLMEYVIAHNKFMLIAHNQIMLAGYPNGIYQIARSEKFKNTVSYIFHSITPEQVEKATTRLRSSWID